MHIRLYARKKIKKEKLISGDPTPSPLPCFGYPYKAMNNNFYNRRQKQAFLDTLELESQKKTYAALFHKFYDFEKERDEDLSTVPVDELACCISRWAMPRSSLMSFISRVRFYVNWCMENNMPFVNPEILDMKTCDCTGEACLRTIMVASPEDLERRLDLVFEPAEHCAIDLPVRAMYWLAFMGVEKQDALNLDCRFVDVERGIVSVNGRDYVIPAPALRTFALCKTARVLNAVSTDGGCRPGLAPVARSRSSVFIRHTNDPGTPEEYNKYVHYVLKKRERLTGHKMQLKYANVKKSGCFYRMYAGFKDHGQWLRADKGLVNSPYEMRAAMSDGLTEYDVNNLFCDAMLFRRDRRIRLCYFEWREIFYGF